MKKKQKESKKLIDLVPFLMHRLIRLMVIKSNKDFSKFNLDVTSARVLIAIRQNSDVSVGELSDTVWMDISTLSYMLSRLQKTGLITRQRKAKDSRKVIVELTAEGREVARECEKLLLEHDRIMTHGLNPREREYLCNLLRDLHESAEEIINKMEQDSPLADPAAKQVSRKSKLTAGK